MRQTTRGGREEEEASTEKCSAVKQSRVQSWVCHLFSPSRQIKCNCTQKKMSLALLGKKYWSGTTVSRWVFFACPSCFDLNWPKTVGRNQVGVPVTHLSRCSGRSRLPADGFQLRPQITNQHAERFHGQFSSQSDSIVPPYQLSHRRERGFLICGSPRRRAR